MSYDIYLVDKKGERIHFDEPHHLKGGTYAVGGTTEAHLNITWNYAEFYYMLFGEKGIRIIYGMTGKQSILVLEKAIEHLDADEDPDYWKATEGNARKALQNLLELAKMAPEGIWEGD